MSCLSKVLPLLAFLCFPTISQAQTTNGLCVWALTNGIATCSNVTASNPLPVNASVTATVTGFAPSLAYATCTATGSSCASTAIPTNTGSMILFNAGTTTVSCTLANGAATALASELQIPASSGLPVATVYGATTYDHFACIDQSGSTSNTVVASGGSGLPTGWGGGGSGGGGGAVTIADNADVAEGALADAATTVGGTGSVSAKLRLMTTQLDAITTGVGAAVPTGTNTIGSVGLAPLTSGGCVPYHLANGTAASTNSTSIKASAGNLCRITAVNTTATIYYLKLYDSASAPTCSSATNLKHVYPILANTAGAGISIGGIIPESYANGIGFCVVGGGSDTDNTNAATGAYIEASYK